jgi:hypothetical protein
LTTLTRKIALDVENARRYFETAKTQRREGTK